MPDDQPRDESRTPRTAPRSRARAAAGRGAGGARCRAPSAGAYDTISSDSDRSASLPPPVPVEPPPLLRDRAPARLAVARVGAGVPRGGRADLGPQLRRLSRRSGSSRPSSTASRTAQPGLVLVARSRGSGTRRRRRRRPRTSPRAPRDPRASARGCRVRRSRRRRRAARRGGGRWSCAVRGRPTGGPRPSPGSPRRRARSRASTCRRRRGPRRRRSARGRGARAPSPSPAPVAAETARTRTAGAAAAASARAAAGSSSRSTLVRSTTGSAPLACAAASVRSMRRGFTPASSAFTSTTRSTFAASTCSAPGAPGHAARQARAAREDAGDGGLLARGREDEVAHHRHLPRRPEPPGDRDEPLAVLEADEEPSAAIGDGAPRAQRRALAGGQLLLEEGTVAEGRQGRHAGFLSRRARQGSSAMWRQRSTLSRGSAPRRASTSARIAPRSPAPRISRTSAASCGPQA